MGIGVTIAALIAGLEPSYAAALSPIAKWQIEYNEEDCILSRPFGPTSQIVTLALRPSANMIAGEMIIMTPSLNDRQVRRGHGTVVLQPSGASFAADWVSAPIGNDRLGVRIGVDGSFWQALRTAESLEFQRKTMPPIKLAIGSMKGATMAITACGLDLLRHWGADPAAMVELPEGVVPRLFSSSDYPIEALNAGQEGLVTTLSTIDRNGKAVRCRVVKSSGSASLDTGTCRIITGRGSIAPRLETGPAERFLLLPVRWVH